RIMNTRIEARSGQRRRFEPGAQKSQGFIGESLVARERVGERIVAGDRRVAQAVVVEDARVRPGVRLRLDVLALDSPQPPLQILPRLVNRLATLVDRFLDGLD